MKVGLSALVTPREWSFSELVGQARGAGYEALEVVPREGSELTLDTPEAALAALSNVARDAGIEITSLCGSGGKPSNLMTSDEAERRAGIETTKAMLRTAKALGADTILHTIGGRPNADLYYHVAYANALRSLQELAPAAEAIGVNIGVEYVWNGFLTSPLEMAQFLDQVGSPRVGFYFDPGNMRIFHQSEHWVRICGRHIKKVHAKDFSWEKMVVQWPPLLKGQVNFPAVMRELRAAGYGGALISEVPPSVASLADTAAAIRQLIEMAGA
ncbi:MAG TPA: sugar phosphate isomerase/epimerase family protein [Planctomycetota bacterium]|nr:sugar phosphate isomerase/epimerase family protein [Planctomycetota bacterium]HRR78571.1 sugar phosphate isomerase/epimerase family protein [Planctomycetota bacterium]HRT96582.1 sugar phosphate isomerase/epimerase family protein [Planctomycetota bacterium]